MSPTVEASEEKEVPPAPLPNAWRVEVFRRAEVEDPAGVEAQRALAELDIEVRGLIRVGKGYLLSPSFEREQVERIASELLTDPTVNETRIVAPSSPPAAHGGPHRVLVLPRPGVMDPVANTVEDLLLRTGHVPAQGAPGVTTYRAIEIHGDLAPSQLELAARRVFANETIEVVRIDREDLPYGSEFPSAPRGRVEVALLQADDAELERLSREGCLSLSLTEMRAIQERFASLGREPSACELETIAQTWSEHCKHKTLTGIVEFETPQGTERIDNLLKSTIARATHELDRSFCVSVFEDNAGIVEFDQGWDLCIKVETHNHPSAIDPYGGAGTGIGGVIRDVLGAGLARFPSPTPIAFSWAPPICRRSACPAARCIHGASCGASLPV